MHLCVPIADLLCAEDGQLIGGVIVLASLVLCFLLFISPLMIWLNLRRLRMNLHADLVDLKASIDRISGTEPARQGDAEENVAAEPSAAPSADESAGSDMIGFSCPECGKFFEGPTEMAGNAYTCPECHVAFQIH